MATNAKKPAIDDEDSSSIYGDGSDTAARLKSLVPGASTGYYFEPNDAYAAPPLPAPSAPATAPPVQGIAAPVPVPGTSANAQARDAQIGATRTVPTNAGLTAADLSPTNAGAVPGPAAKTLSQVNQELVPSIAGEPASRPLFSVTAGGGDRAYTVTPGTIRSGILNKASRGVLANGQHGSGFNNAGDLSTIVNSIASDGSGFNIADAKAGQGQAPQVMMHRPLDDQAAQTLHDRVDFSKGSTNWNNTQQKARYQDEVMDAMRVNAAGGVVPTAEQMKAVGMDNAQLSNFLASNNRDGRFDNAIKNIQSQTALDNSLAEKRYGIDAQLTERKYTADQALLGHQIAAQAALGAAGLNASGRVEAARARGDQGGKNQTDLIKAYYNHIKSLNLPAQYAGKQMDLAKKMALAADPNSDYGIYYNQGTPNRGGIFVQKSLFEPLLNRYRSAGYPEADAQAWAVADLQKLQASHGGKLYEDFPRLERLSANANKPADLLATLAARGIEG